MLYSQVENPQVRETLGVTVIHWSLELGPWSQQSPGFLRNAKGDLENVQLHFSLHLYLAMAGSALLLREGPAGAGGVPHQGWVTRGCQHTDSRG